MTNPNAHLYAGLHSHYDGSILDGAQTPAEGVAETKRLGQKHAAITDHGTLFRAYDFYTECLKEGIHPVIGIEAYIAPSHVTRHHHESAYFAGGGKDDVSSKGSYTHMLLFAKNNQGLKDLYNMVYLSYAEGNWRKNRMDIDMLREYGHNLIATTGCPSGELQTKLRLGMIEEAEEYVVMMQQIFGKEDYYMEIMNHDMTIELERTVESELLRIAKKYDMPLLATADSHYTTANQANMHEHMLCISTHSKMSVPTTVEEGEGGKTRFAFDGTGYHLNSYDEMIQKFPEDKYPNAVTNTVKLAEKCNIDIIPDPELRPRIEIPEGHTEDSYLREQAWEGFHRRFPDPERGENQEYIDRLEEELDTIITMNYPGYFLVVSDFIRWAKNQGIRVGPGRGCLTEETRVLTSEGFKSIKNIKIGDRVYNQNGTLETVSNTFIYDIKEELIEIKAFYGGEGNIMTTDHKVLVSKANLTGKTGPKSIKYKKEINPVEWIPASEIEIGDLVVLPKTEYVPDTFSFNIDPLHEAPTNLKYEHNQRAIAEKTGLARSTVMRFFRNEGFYDESRMPGMKKIDEYLKLNNLNIEDMISRQTVRVELDMTSIDADYDLGWLMGVFISDGWFRKDSRNEVGFCNQLSKDDGKIQDTFKKIFGIDLTVQESSNGSDLVQFTSTHKGIVNLFRGLFPEYKSTSQTKYIPREFHTTPQEFKEGLLEGLWSGDGTHSGKSKYVTVSKRLAEGVAELLLSLGLPASIKSSVREELRPEFNKYNKGPQTNYSVTTAHNFKPDNIMNNAGIKYDGKYSYFRVREINHIPSADVKVYDFTMPETHSYVTDSYIVHNSAAGSLLAYVLDITDAEPIRHGLLFSRFISKERPSPPDVDIDFDDEKRELVIEYVREKYGEDHVAQVVTFGMIKAKNAVKDVLRIYDEPYSVGDQLTKAMPEAIFGKTMPLKNMYTPGAPRYEEAGDFRNLVEEMGVKDKIDIALQLEERIRSTGVHACAVIISNKPVKEAVPVMVRKDDGALITQWEYPVCEDLGLLKMDFLGLRNLGIIDNALKLIKARHNVDIDMQEIFEGPMDDAKTYRLLQSGKTLGVFQLDSGPIQDLLKLMQADRFEDISAVLALYRPGPIAMGSPELYSKRKTGVEPVEPIHPDLAEVLEPVLGETFGLLTYQEQIMKIAQEVSGYTLGEADLLRRAMGKKKKEEMDAQWEKFYDGGVANGYSREALEKLWEGILPFADYAFNKSHSVAYGLISYMTAYLKANFTVEYMSALLSSVADNVDKTAEYLEDCRRLGVQVLPPDINLSGVDYEPVSGVGESPVISFGLKAIRGLGESSGGMIVALREGLPGKRFNSVDDLFNAGERELVNKRVLEGLANGGGLDSLGFSRRSWVYHIPELVKQFQKVQRSKAKTQTSLFDLDDVVEYKLYPMDEYPRLEKLKIERTALGLYVSGHPVDGLDLSAQSSVEVAGLFDGRVTPVEGFPDRRAVPVRLAGVVTSLVVKRNKQGKPFAIMRLEDRSGSVECLMFWKQFERLGSLLKVDEIYQFSGFARIRDESINFTVDGVKPLDFSASGNLSVRFKVTEGQWAAGEQLLMERLANHPAPVGEPGDDVVVSVRGLDVSGEVFVKEIRLDVKVSRSPALLQEIQELFGSRCIGRWVGVKNKVVIDAGSGSGESSAQNGATLGAGNANDAGDGLLDGLLED